MNIVGETRCKLCSNIINYDNSKIIDGHVQDILDVLLLKLNLDGDANFLCDSCCTKLFAAFDFKVICINTEDTIFPYTNSEEGKVLDLSDIYLKECEDKQLKETAIDKKVCRLCFQVISNEAVPFEEVNRDNIRRYIPEVNFNSTQDPVFCKTCHESLDNHCKFLKSCTSEEMNKQETSYEAINTHGSTLKSCSGEEETKCDVSYKPIDSRSDLLKPCIEEKEEKTKFEVSYDSIDSHSDCLNSYLEIEETKCITEVNKNSNLDANNPLPFECNGDVDSQRNSQDKSTVYSCKKCEFETTNIHMFKKHISEHTVPDKKAMFQCDQCEYKTKRKHHVVEHQFIHSAPLVVQIYKCDECDYEGIFKTFFMRHQQEHTWHRCKKCHYKSRRKSRVTNHKCVPLKQKIYRCDECDYETKFNRYLETHRLKHNSTVKLFKCTTCTYETQSKNSLGKHERVVHQERMLKCEICKYKTKKKAMFNKHKKKHENHKLRDIYKCDKCPFESKYSRGMENHEISHQNPSEVHIYKCHKCGHETKYKYNFKKHLRRHEEPVEIAANATTEQDSSAILGDTSRFINIRPSFSNAILGASINPGLALIGVYTGTLPM